MIIPSFYSKCSFNNRFQKNKINSFKKDPTKEQICNYSGIEYFFTNISSRNISFRGKEQNVMTSKVYKDFVSEYKKIFGNIPVEDTIKESLNSAKMIGRGREKEVYDFPKMPGYIISKLYQIQPRENLPIQEIIPIELPKYNFGQSFASNTHDILIKKKIEGIPNGIDDYVNFIRTIFKLNDVTKEMANNYLYKLRLFKDFPQQSYDDLAQKIEYITNNGLKYVDSFNPNNLLIDVQNKQFNIIDVSLRDNSLVNSQLRYPNCYQDKTSVYDIINLLLDTKFQYYFLKHLSPEEQREVISASDNVIKKCINATKDLDLSRTDDFFIKTIAHMDKKRDRVNGNLQYKAYSEFKKMYQDVLSKISDYKRGANESLQ